MVLFVDQLSNITSEWAYSSLHSTKVGHKLNWLDDIIAAQKDSSLTIEWLEVFKAFLKMDNPAQNSFLAQCGLSANLPFRSDPSRLRLDMLQCILNRRAQSLESTPNSN